MKPSYIHSATLANICRLTHVSILTQIEAFSNSMVVGHIKPKSYLTTLEYNLTRYQCDLISCRFDLTQRLAIAEFWAGDTL